MKNKAFIILKMVLLLILCCPAPVMRVKADQNAAGNPSCNYCPNIEYDRNAYIRYDSLPRTLAFNPDYTSNSVGFSKKNVLGYMVFQTTCLISAGTTAQSETINVIAFEVKVKPQIINQRKNITGYPIECSVMHDIPIINILGYNPQSGNFSATNDVNDLQICSLEMPLCDNLSEDNDMFVVKSKMFFQNQRMFLGRGRDIQSRCPRMLYKYFFIDDSALNDWICGNTFLTGNVAYVTKKTSMSGQTLLCHYDVIMGAAQIAADGKYNRLYAKKSIGLCHEYSYFRVYF